MGVDQAMRLVEHWLVGLIVFVLGVFTLLEGALRGVMFQMRISEQAQTVIMVLLAVALIVVTVRLLGGIFRLLIMVFLVLLLVHLLMGGGVHA